MAGATEQPSEDEEVGKVPLARAAGSKNSSTRLREAPRQRAAQRRLDQRLVGVDEVLGSRLESCTNPEQLRTTACRAQGHSKPAHEIVGHRPLPEPRGLGLRAGGRTAVNRIVACVVGPSAEIAYDQALRALTEQRERLKDLRTRASTLISAAAIATSFLGSEALRDTKTGRAGTLVSDRTLQLAEIVAIVAFVVMLALCLFIVIPRFRRRGGWRFGIDASKIVGAYVDTDKSLDYTRRDVALHFQNDVVSNAEPLELRYLLFALAAGLLGVEVLAWLFDLTSV